MKPTQVRSRVLDDHARLRWRLDEIESLAQRFEAGDAEGDPTLRKRGLALYESFAEHLDLEDRLLAPALRAAGAPERALRLAHEHREQRELLGYLLGRLKKQGQPTTLVARELRNFVEYVRFDMTHEEETMLTAAVLSDVDAARNA